MNYRYAKQHGYHFTFYQMPRKKTCSHSVHGARHPSWCKLVTLVHAQKQHPKNKYRAYLDSDMYVQHQEISIDQLLKAAIPQVPSSSAICAVCKGSNCQDQVQQGNGWLMTSSEGLLGSFVMLRGGQRGDDILKKICNSGSGAMAGFNQGFPWEQMAWNAAYKKSLHTDGRIVGIAGLDANWTGHQPPTACNQFDGGVQLDVWSMHTCHFEDDQFQMMNRGDIKARERIRNLLGCGPEWNTTMNGERLTEEQNRKLAHHDLYAGYRKMKYLRSSRTLR